MKKYSGTLLMIVTLIIFLVLIFVFGDTPNGNIEEISYQEFIRRVNNDDSVGAVYVQEANSKYVIYGLNRGSQKTEENLYKGGQADFYCSDITSLDQFNLDISRIVAAKKGIAVESVTTADYPFTYDIQQYQSPSIWVSMLPYILMTVGIGAVLFFMVKSQTSARQGTAFGKDRVRAMVGNMENITFDNVAGLDEEKNELKEVVEFLRNPQRFTRMGAKIPSGVLLVGPPGTGKTLLAKAAAGEANVPFFAISGSDFVELYVGLGASRVRDLFNMAKKSSPAVVFIDEIDAVGRQRGSGMGGGHDEREQTLNQLLVEMDGFAPNEGIIVIAATNRVDILDPALLRPGRFDRRITVGYPDIRGREDILKVHVKKKPLADEVDLSVIARSTPGFTGADLENLLNEAAILAARYGKDKITNDEIEESITRVLMGPEKTSRLLLPEDKRITAYHEAGHAIVALKLPNCDPLHEVSIIPHGDAGGYTATLPKNDNEHITKSKLLDNIAMLLGGRACEIIALSDISTGASNDIQRASDIARRMVVEFGMSDAIGPVFLGNESEFFLGRDIGHMQKYSQDVAAKVDTEVKLMLETQFERAKSLINEDRVALDRVSEALVEYERLSGVEFEAVYKGEAISIVPYKQKQQKRKEDMKKREQLDKQEAEALKRKRAEELKALIDAENAESDKDSDAKK